MLARHGDGALADLRALASQVHPVFMLPPLAASAFGAVLAARLHPSALSVHLLAVFAGLYTAHLKDGYVDFHLRGEDDDHPLTARGCRLALAGSTLLFVIALAGIVALAGPVAGLLTIPGWLIGYLHAPQLDMHPVTATVGYPTGIAFALVGGHYVQARAFDPTVIGFAVVFLVTLSGIKVIDDAKDFEYDRSIDKRTVAVALGRSRAHRVAYVLMATGMLAVGAGAVVGPFPAGAVLAPAVFLVVAATAYRAPPEHATKLLIRGSYVFLAVLVGSVWFRPFG